MSKNSKQKRKQKRVRQVLYNNLRKFVKKTFWKLCGKIVELGVLFAIGYSLGLKLIRY